MISRLFLLLFVCSCAEKKPKPQWLLGSVLEAWDNGEQCASLDGGGLFIWRHPHDGLRSEHLDDDTMATVLSDIVARGTLQWQPMPTGARAQKRMTLHLNGQSLTLSEHAGEKFEALHRFACGGLGRRGAPYQSPPDAGKKLCSGVPPAHD